ncbi:MAG: hypothetical protein ACI3XZ_04005 [Butyricicoccus sp.]
MKLDFTVRSLFVIFVELQKGGEKMHTRAAENVYNRIKGSSPPIYHGQNAAGRQVGCILAF